MNRYMWWGLLAYAGPIVSYRTFVLALRAFLAVGRIAFGGRNSVGVKSSLALARAVGSQLVCVAASNLGRTVVKSASSWRESRSAGRGELVFSAPLQRPRGVVVFEALVEEEDLRDLSDLRGTHGGEEFTLVSMKAVKWRTLALFVDDTNYQLRLLEINRKLSDPAPSKKSKKPKSAAKSGRSSDASATAGNTERRMTRGGADHHLSSDQVHATTSDRDEEAGREEGGASEDVYWLQEREAQAVQKNTMKRGALIASVECGVLCMGGFDAPKQTNLITWKKLQQKSSSSSSFSGASADAISKQPSSREHHQACSAAHLGHGQVAALSSTSGDSRIECYRQSHNKWGVWPHEGAPQTRNAGLAYVGDVLYSLGGRQEASHVTNGVWALQLPPELEANRIHTRVWRRCASMLKQREHFGVVALRDRVAVFGGSDGACVLAAVEVYDTSRDQWFPGPRLNFARARPSVLVIGPFILVLNGVDDRGAAVPQAELITCHALRRHKVNRASRDCSGAADENTHHHTHPRHGPPPPAPPKVLNTAEEDIEKPVIGEGGDRADTSPPRKKEKSWQIVATRKDLLDAKVFTGAAPNPGGVSKVWDEATHLAAMHRFSLTSDSEDDHLQSVSQRDPLGFLLPDYMTNGRLT